MNEENVMKDIATMILRQSHELEMEPGDLADKADIDMAALTAMTMADSDGPQGSGDLHAVMRVLDILGLELIVIPKED